MKIKVFDITGKTVKEIEIASSVFGIKPHKQAMFDTVVSQQAALRQGTRKVKTRGEVRGGGKKPWRQKGTGRARQGSIRAPQWRGGGVVFGPTPNINYKKMVNKKVRQLAIKSALSIKAKEVNLIIVDQFKFAKPSTKGFIKLRKDLSINENKTLVVTLEDDFNVAKSSSNIQGVKTIDVIKLNLFDIMNAKTLLITEDAVRHIEEVYA
ncbi:50S ribosomal protein L4 [Spiroplasma endosymbiont of Othius punctulatus]|uniref:50S ribosomal protein L4 n=1 Tax=Spiroplasma endosymbiont of Othius punctulatus TaxID=3066289 RepID=UPI0030CA9803